MRLPDAATPNLVLGVRVVGASLKVWPTANRISVIGTYQPTVVKLYGEPTK